MPDNTGRGIIMKRRILKTAWILILIAIMLLPPLRAATAAGFNYYESIYIYKYPDKLNYYVGESFDKTGMRIFGNRVKADGSKDVAEFTLDNLIVSPGTFTKVGTNQKVTIRLDCMAASGKKEPFYVYLYVNVEEMEGDPPLYWTKKITATATKTAYLVGDSFDKSSLTVWAHSEGDVPPGDEKWDCTKFVKSISPSKFTKAGEQYVTVTANLTTQYGTADFTAKIKVKVYDKVEITKHPGGETVKEGGSCAFTVKGNNVEHYSWFFVNDYIVIPVKEKDAYFPGLKVSGAHEKKLKLSNIPPELDGWSVMCELSNEMDLAESDAAPIYVLANETAAPSAGSTAEPSAGPTAEPTAAPTAEPTAVITVEAPTEAPVSTHAHSFDGVYHSDGKQHWLECECGERTAAADHVVAEWKILAKPTKDEPGVRRGYCAVCGAELLEDIPYEGGGTGDMSSLLMIVGFALAGVACIGFAVALAFVISRNKRSGKREQ